MLPGGLMPPRGADGLPGGLFAAATLGGRVAIRGHSLCSLPSIFDHLKRAVLSESAARVVTADSGRRPSGRSSSVAVRALVEFCAPVLLPSLARDCRRRPLTASAFCTCGIGDERLSDRREARQCRRPLLQVIDGISNPSAVHDERRAGAFAAAQVKLMSGYADKIGGPGFVQERWGERFALQSDCVEGLDTDTPSSPALLDREKDAPTPCPDGRKA